MRRRHIVTPKRPLSHFGLKEAVVGVNIATKEYHRAKSSFPKIFWTLVFCMSTTVFLFDAYVSIQNYLSYPVVTNYAIKQENHLEYPTPFVVVTNSFDLEALKKFDFPEELIPFLVTVYQGDQYDNYTSDYLQESLIKYRKWTKTQENFHLGRFLLKTAANTDIFGNCTYKRSEIPCTAYLLKPGGITGFDYQGPGFAMFGVGLTPGLVQTNAGERGMFTMNLRYSGEHVKRYVPNREPFIKVSLFQLDYTADMLAWDFFRAQGGYRYHVSVSKRKVMRHPKRGCHYINWQDFTGTLEFCRRGCEVKANMIKYNCTVVGSANFVEHVNLCEPGLQSITVHRENQRLKCEQCHVDSCRIIQNTRVLQTTKIHGSSDKIIVDFFHRSLIVIEITEQLAMSSLGIVGNIGGVASLLLNLRFATIAQLLVYFLQWLQDRAASFIFSTKNDVRISSSQSFADKKRDHFIKTYSSHKL